MSKERDASYNTQISYERDLRKLKEYLANQGITKVQEVRETSLNSYVLFLEKEGKAASTVSRYIASWKGFFEYCLRQGIISVDPGQTEGAKAIGMTHWQTMIQIILPQALRNIMPQIGNNFIINVKDTSVMFIISFTELFAAHRYIVGVNNMYFPSAAIEMIAYLTMTLAASFLLRWIEQKMDGEDTYELASEDALAMSAGTYSHPDRGTPFDERSKEFQMIKKKGGGR